MKTLIIVSKCLRVTKFNFDENHYEFHFKGVFAGAALRKVVLLACCKLGLKKNEDYLLYVQLLKIEKGVLTGKVLKARLLDDCWDKS
jgi:hypothetical protein